MLLETYSVLNDQSLRERLPSFLNIAKEVTGNPNYSMFNLSLREDWKTSKKFCPGISIYKIFTFKLLYTNIRF